jgi:hypothetical protein
LGHLVHGCSLCVSSVMTFLRIVITLYLIGGA